MYIDEESCINCQKCIPICPMGAISQKEEENIQIDYEACVECGTCKRSNVCPEDSIKQVDELPYPRILRAAFSDPMHSHESTEVLGRGTEEMKTNDVTGKFEREEVGLSVELGRPGIGTYFSDVEKVTKKLASVNVSFAEDNPIVYLMEDEDTGALKSEVLDEKVLSAIVECVFPEDRALNVLREVVNLLEEEIETVASVGLIIRGDESGNIPILKDLESSGFNLYPNGKVNIGITLAEGEEQ